MSASTAVADHGTSAGHWRVRSNGCKPIWFTSAVLLRLVFFFCQWGTHEGVVKIFLRLKSNGKEKRVIFFKLSLATQCPSHTFLRLGTTVAGSPLPCTWFPGILDDDAFLCWILTLLWYLSWFFLFLFFFFFVFFLSEGRLSKTLSTLSGGRLRYRLKTSATRIYSERSKWVHGLSWWCCFAGPRIVMQSGSCGVGMST